jgi:hypothetical protein
MSDSAEDLDRRIRIALYDVTVTTGAPPLAAALAARMALPEEVVRESFERLAAGRVVVLQRESREILMAAPFSAVATPFAVRATDRLYYANCVWDGLGILAMLRRDGEVRASCGCCGEAMTLATRGNRLAPAEGVVHFAIPARRWWEDIVVS